MSSLGTYNEKRKNRWYFGGIASATAACITHPLDLLKVMLQTQTNTQLEKGSTKQFRMIQLIAIVIRTEGVMGLYNGISASMMRQLTFTLTCMGVYEHFKYYIPNNNATMQLFLAVGAGVCGAFVGMPAEVANVRMQNDMRLPAAQRRNYKNVIDGLSRIVKDEGFTTLYAGTTPNIIRGIFMTMSTNVVYDRVKYRLLEWGFRDNISTHILCAITAACSGTTVTMPIDVIKTRMMNAESSKMKSIFATLVFTSKQGPLAFYKGYIPAMVRAVPHTAILFLLMEQMRLYYGRLPTLPSKQIKHHKG